MKEVILGAVVGTSVILGAISLFIAVAYTEEFEKKIPLKFGSNHQAVRYAFGMITFFLKFFLIASLATVYLRRADLHLMSFVLSYGLTTLLIVLICISGYFFLSLRKR